jgi:DNA-binding Lrp family transcriptional regulator
MQETNQILKLLEKDGKLTVQQMAVMLGMTPEQVAAAV